MNICFNLLHLLNTNWRIKYFFLILPKYNSTKFNNSNNGTVNAIQKKLAFLHEMGKQIKSSLLIKTLSCSKFILTSVFIFLQSSFLFQYGEKAMKTYIILKKHPNNDNKIYPLPSSSCFQRYFYDWLYVLGYNSDLSKLEWTLLLFNFNHFNHFNNCSSRWVWFSQQAKTLKTNLLGLISNFIKYCFKTGTVCLLSLSSHAFTALELDCNHFGILLWKIVKPCDHNKIKPPIEKYSENINHSDILLWCPEINYRAHL